jgi:glycosyltransferase involved in cell wall biosynthesis
MPIASSNRDITAVIPCFNYGAFVAECVQSVLTQDGDDPRVIVVDDGSTDARTLAELDRLPPQVELVCQANSGVAAARNTGLRQVQTRYALMLDADDQLATGALQILREVLDADPAVGFSYGLLRFVGAWEGIWRIPPYDPYALLYRHSIGSAALIRRKLFEDVGGFDPALKGYEDWEFWLHALECGWRGQRVGTVTTLYRRHQSTRHLGERPYYRRTFRQIRRKHPALYGRAGRRRLKRASDLGWAGRVVHRWWWGVRPLPARVELTLQSTLWSPKKK